MSELTISWEYLTGYAVATNPSNRDRAEWPPHPARVFMALAAAWFETGEDAKEGEALRWLEDLGDPELRLPSQNAVFERSKITVFVPINDLPIGRNPGVLQSVTGWQRSKQPRTFPRVWLGNTICEFNWPEADNLLTHRDALDRLCRKVTRIGHSSSLVRMWVGDDERAVQNDNSVERIIPDAGLAEVHTRAISAGMLDMLVERFGAEPRQCRADLTKKIESLKASKKQIKGTGSKARKAEMDVQIKPLESELFTIVVRPPARPTIGLWTGYRRANVQVDSTLLHPHFDTDLLVLKQTAGPPLPAASTLAVTRALRNTIMKQSGIQPVPAWVSGHQPDGKPLQTDNGHLACIPLPFVGHEHADGHLLGVGLVFPRAVSRKERGQVLGKILVEQTGKPKAVQLKLGRLGVWTVEKSDWSEHRNGLQPETWTANYAKSPGATTWASVTPVVLDKFPKSNRIKDRAGWTHEVVENVAAACQRIGLPEPIGIDIDTTSWHLGSPRSVGKRRRLRGHDALKDADAALGDGFSPYLLKGTNAPRPQVHVWLQFDEPMLGPILLGAGRYLGYGLCKPWENRR